MIDVDIDGTKEFMSDIELEQSVLNAKKAFQKLKEGAGPGSEWLGWRRILKAPNDAELDKIEQHGAEIRKNADIFIVCGIGGSYQGARAIIDALQKPFSESKPEIYFAGHHLGARYHEELIDYISRPKEDGSRKSVYLNVISKSGSTLETAIAFRMIRKWMHEVYGDEAKSRIIATTGAEGGILNKIIEEEAYSKYVIPDDVGGRFSVMTPVGLLPVAVSGLDIKTLFYGAVAEFESREKEAGNILDYAAVRHHLHEKNIKLDVISSFEPELKEFCNWTQQLLGESEGKEGKGLFPAVASYSTDLHSIGQMIQQGRRNIMETMITVEKPVSDLKLTPSESKTDGLDYLAGKSLHYINKSAQDGTFQAHLEGGVPVVKIGLGKLNEQQLGRLIYFYELLTGIYVYMLNVNPFNQPGVENYKKAMYKLLGK
ncbi:glucose-6-phosphate isomerase [Rhodohalobacter sp. 8-1]|uniref:glucose-6-phosphate isomerase n=1 Tax=Rhodohalobacter sp. 8-1 TaxID=3131972 RepID=UPI0030ED7343